MTRRTLMRLAAALPAGASFAPLRTFAAPLAQKVKITAIKALQIRGIAGNCLIKIDTDSGLTGYGEAGVTGPMARARIETMKQHLIGKDPLAIEVHFHNLTTLMHTYMANIPTISGIDMALWDLAGKITGQPVSSLLGGPFRDAIQLYSHGVGMNMLDKGSCKAFADRVKAMPEGFTTFKCDIHPMIGVQMGRYINGTLDGAQIRRVAQAYANAREALGSDIDIAVHCHNELDVPSAIAVAKAVEPMNPLFYEDPMPPAYSDGWQQLRNGTRLTILAGEKLEMVAGFRPFIDHHVADIIHPDLAFCGGFTGGKKIADYAALARVPVALHNVGSLVLCYANAHFGASIQNFYRSESALGRPTRYIEDMAAGTPPEVKNSRLKLPEGPGLGLEINPDFLKKNMVQGEEYWA
jgi:L-alanine-DL-glutamate epimerase-like enolase superfamily enzyme